VVLVPGPLLYVFVALTSAGLYVPFSLHITLGQDYLPQRAGITGGVTLGLAVTYLLYALMGISRRRVSPHRGWGAESAARMGKALSPRAGRATRSGVKSASDTTGNLSLPAVQRLLSPGTSS
jgi:hypothetical protein